MPTHAVGQQQQQSFSREAVAHSILVTGTPTDVAVLIDSEAHV
jgi:hypothetical protein